MVCFDMILPASFEGQEFEAKSKGQLEQSELELSGLELVLCRYR